MKGASLRYHYQAFALIPDWPRCNWRGKRWRRRDGAWTRDTGAFEDRFSACFFSESPSHETASLEILLVSSAILTNTEFSMLLEEALGLLEHTLVLSTGCRRDNNHSAGYEKGKGKENSDGKLHKQEVQLPDSLARAAVNSSSMG